MTISPFDSDREVAHCDVQPGNRYRMAFSLDGGATYRVRNVACEIDNQGSRRIRWCDELWQAYPPTNGADIGLLVDQMDELVRFELVPSLPDLLSAENRKRSIERINSSDPVRVVERVANSLSIENRLAKHEERERGERDRRIDEINQSLLGEPEIVRDADADVLGADVRDADDWDWELGE